MRTFTIRAWGPYALFCPAHFRADPCSEPVPTPSAVAGLYREIYWKPQFEWVIQKIFVMKPILYMEMKTTGITASPIRNGRFGKDRTRPIEPSSMQQLHTFLVDVEYLFEARLQVNHSALDGRPGHRTQHDYEQMVHQILLDEPTWGQPCFGSSELFASYEYLPRGSDDSPIRVSMPLGPMLVGHLPIDPKKDLWDPVFHRLEMVDGVIEVPSSAYEKLLPSLNASAGKLARQKAGVR
jgi:CRISPR-associated protein Cas5d